MDEDIKQQKRMQDLEQWRKQTMTDKLYFLCATASTKKGRNILYKSMPSKMNQVKSKVRGQIKKSTDQSTDKSGQQYRLTSNNSKMLTDNSKMLSDIQITSPKKQMTNYEYI